MMSRTIICIVLLTMQEMTCQAIQKTALEGHTRGVDILCDLDQQIYPLYWNIQGKVYDLYSIPEIFEVLDREGIRPRIVDRRMDGWSFQCFTIGPNNEEGLNFGQITTLTVVYVLGTPLQNQRDDVSLLEPSWQGRPVLHYQMLKEEKNSMTLQWFYTPDSTSSCGVPKYRIYVFALSDADSLEKLEVYEARDKNKTIESHSLTDEADNTMKYVQISVIRDNNSTCANSAYLYGINASSHITSEVHANGTSASFEIPENLRGDRSIQLVWSKDNVTQCVCPPVEQFMSQCACNIDDPNSNIITISNGNITISNLTNLMGYGGRTTLYFVSSLSGACDGNCHLQSVAHVYDIIQGHPLPPVVSYYNANNTFCFTIPDNPIHPEVYEVNLTDSTGSLTRLSGIYDTSQCLTITSDLYPETHGPLQLSVVAMNNVGREGTELTLVPSSEPTPHDCSQQKDSDIAEILLACGVVTAVLIITLVCVILCCFLRRTRYTKEYFIHQGEAATQL